MRKDMRSGVRIIVNYGKNYCAFSSKWQRGGIGQGTASTGDSIISGARIISISGAHFRGIKNALSRGKC